MIEERTTSSTVKISELKKGEYARIHGMFSEVLAASGLDAERFYVKARCFKTGIVFEDKPLPSKEVDLPAFSRKEYMLLNIDEIGNLFLETLNKSNGNDDIGDGFSTDSDTTQQRNDVTLPEGEMREKIRERFDRDNIICVTLVNADGEVGVESFTEGTGK